MKLSGNKYNIIFMGTPEFSVPALEALITNHEVKLVVCQPDRINKRGKKVEYVPVKKVAIESSLPIFQPEDINSQEAVEYLSTFDVDFIVVVAYGQLIKKPVREIAKENIVNIHASLLPKYRGAAPINHAIMDRENITGVSIMKVDKGMDKGEVYLTSETKVGNKTYPELYEELSKMGASLLMEYLELYSMGEASGVLQDDSKATIAPKINKELGILDFHDVNDTIGKILGLTPKPGAQCEYRGEVLKLHRGEILSQGRLKDKAIGEIIEVSKDGITINCGNGIILVTKLQFPAKKILSVKDYLAGNEILPGEILR